MNNSEPRRLFSGAPAARLFCLSVAALLLIDCDRQKDTPAPPPQASTRPELSSGAAFSADNAYTHTAALCALGPRPSGSPAYAEQLRYLEQHLTTAGWQVQRDRFHPENAPLPMVNLRAQFGENSDTRPVLLSCHIDTKQIPDFIGADDGASGVGVLLELARVLAQKPATAAAVEIIFFDGEESFAPRMTDKDGLYGSKYDVARRNGALPRYQINLDMVGGRNALIAIPALDTSDFMLRCYAESVLATGLSPERWTAIQRSYLDDHRPYLNAGVDSLNIIASFSGSDWWHTPGDTLERLSPRTMGECGRLVLQLLSQLILH